MGLLGKPTILGTPPYRDGCTSVFVFEAYSSLKVDPQKKINHNCFAAL